MGCSGYAATQRDTYRNPTNSSPTVIGESATTLPPAKYSSQNSGDAAPTIPPACGGGPRWHGAACYGPPSATATDHGSCYGPSPRCSSPAGGYLTITRITTSCPMPTSPPSRYSTRPLHRGPSASGGQPRRALQVHRSRPSRLAGLCVHPRRMAAHARPGRRPHRHIQTGLTHDLPMNPTPPIPLCEPPRFSWRLGLV